MKIACKTDKGRKLEINQDAVFADEERGLVLLADGVGVGNNRGEVASELAVREAYAYIKKKVDQSSGKAVGPGLLSEAIVHAHNAINEKARCEKEFGGMCTTLIILLVQGRTAFICHVGDSRAYVIRKGIYQLTEDQTFQNSVDQNAIIRSLFFQKKRRSLMQAVGASPVLSPESVSLEVEDGAVILLCSDGLTDMLSDPEILRIVHSNNFDPQRSVNALISEANEEGGSDNITAALVEV